MFKLDPTQPLGLPEGSVRALLVIMLVGVFCYLCLTGGTIPPVLEEMVKWGGGAYGLLRAGTALLKAPGTPIPPGPPTAPPDVEP